MLSSWDSSLNECQRIAGKNVVEQLIALPPSPFLSLPSAHLASPSIHRHFTQYLLISYWGMPFLWAWTPAALLSLPQAALASLFMTTLSLVMTRKEKLLMLQNPLIGYVKTSVTMIAERHALRWCILMSAIIKESDAAVWYLLTFPKPKPVLSAAYLVNHWFLYLLNSISVFRVIHNHLQPRYNVTSFALKEGNWMRAMLSEFH